MLPKGLKTLRSDVFTEIDIQNGEIFAMGQLLEAGISDRVLEVVCIEFFEIELVFKESNNRGFLKLMTERDIDSCQLFTGNSQLNDYLVSDRHCCKV